MSKSKKLSVPTPEELKAAIAKDKEERCRQFVLEMGALQKKHRCTITAGILLSEGKVESRINAVPLD